MVDAPGHVDAAKDDSQAARLDAVLAHMVETVAHAAVLLSSPGEALHTNYTMGYSLTGTTGWRLVSGRTSIG